MIELYYCPSWMNLSSFRWMFEQRMKNMILKNLAIKPILKSRSVLPKELKNSQCLLTISVGQEVHEAEKFEATIDLVKRSFASCIILIDDTLQRYTMALQTSKEPDDFYKRTLEEGDLWLERNKNAIEKIGISHSIIRWDKWLNHDKYNEQHQIILELTRTDLPYKQAFDDTIQKFLERYYARLQNKNLTYLERDFALCLNYLIEECAAFCLWPKLQCHFEVYPSKRNLAMEETHKRFILPKYPNLLHPIFIKFKNRK